MRSAAPAWPARGRRALLTSDCPAGSANSSGACAACAVGSYAPGGSAVVTLTAAESPSCYLADGNSNGDVTLNCAFASAAPALASAPGGEAAACVFPADTSVPPSSNNCTLRYVYTSTATAFTVATVADCTFASALLSALNASLGTATQCAVFGSGGALA